MRVILRAPLLSISGYGIHSRQIFEWLESIPEINLTVDIVKWGMTAWNLNHDSHEGLIGRIMKLSRPVEGLYDLSFQVQLPDEWDNKLAKKNIGISAFVETDKCNPSWIQKCNEMDEVIVPSEFTKSVALKSGNINTPVHVVPEWFNEKISDDLNPLKLNLNPKFNFLMVGTITGRTADNDRKNLFYGLKWFCETFKDNRKVGLVLKTSYGKGTTIDRQMTLTTIKNVIDEVRVGKFPKITVLHGNFSESEIASLYKHKKIMCLLSPTRGEGYGLPLIEAAASGLPVAVTGWSGHTDFLEDGLYSKFDYTLKAISAERVDNRIFMKGTQWAEVKESSFKEKILDVNNNYELHSMNALKLKSKVRRKYCKESVMKVYSKALKKYF